MSSDRTGFACGTLKPCVYYENSSGYIILAPAEKGRDDLARMVYETRYGPAGWEYREVHTLADLDKLEKRLIAQEERAAAKMILANSRVREVVRDAVRHALKERMANPDASKFEQEFIETYLKLHEQQRDKFRDRLEHHNHYIYAAHMDSSTKLEVE